ncbi:hypothetical protein PQ465_00555 [Sphingobacterium oryzagri]|uniref:Uncharacterized protein n=1 Tax=Sphingobacterium oryzagri TaxID=3025669 RepID=A0ABY7WGY7_9SPHI|nr:hypothetical protein [Sphingobacterium sp. KACC 22765]WDF68883.1 hypothetical protein PQ465_00555 [Sphingobacterium sp. KACC 22765]
MYHEFNVGKRLVQYGLLGLLLVLFSVAAVAQKKQKLVIEQVNAIQVDADLSDWSSMIDVANEGRWSFQVGQDIKALYAAVRIVDPVLQQMAITHGIVFTFNAQQKKTSASTFIFPFLDSETKRALANTARETDAATKNSLIKRARGYFVRGFSAVPDGIIALQNGYGLLAEAVAQDEALQYELVIPKSLLKQVSGSVLLGLAIHDGFSYPTQSAVRRMPGKVVSPEPANRSAKQKNSQTTAVLLETQLN